MCNKKSSKNKKMGYEALVSSIIISKIAVLVVVCCCSPVFAAFAQPYNESPSVHKQKSWKDSKSTIRFADTMPKKYYSPINNWHHTSNQSCHTLNASKSVISYEPDSESGGLVSQSKLIYREKMTKATKNSISSSYYLISSRKAILQILVVASFLLICDMIFPSFRQWSRDINLFLLPTSNLSVSSADNACHMKLQWSWIWSRTQTWKRAQQVVLPMLSSACCLFQILLNLFSVGCAGFNTYLGPIRPISIGLLSYFSIVSLPIQLSSTKHSQLFFSVLKYTSYWAISLLPELLYIWNNRNVSWPYMSHKKESITKQKLNEETKTVNIQLHIPTMGCSACVNKVDTSLSKFLKNTLRYDQSEQNIDTSSSRSGKINITGVTIRSWLLDAKNRGDEKNEEHPSSQMKLEKGGIAQITFQVNEDPLDGSKNYNETRSKGVGLLEQKQCNRLHSVLSRDDLVKAVEMAGFKNSTIISYAID